MATVLLAWELGGGMGHLARLRPIAEELVRRGHRVIAALRDLSRVRDVLSSSQIDFIPAPHKTSRIGSRFDPPCTYAHILHNTGFGDEHELATLVSAWRTIFKLVKPDLMLLDHAPLAVLASRGWPARRTMIGLGFMCPPDIHPLPVLPRPQRTAHPEQWARDEAAVLDVANRVLGSSGQAPLERLGQLYGQVDESFLVTFAELDHFGPRKGTRYWGAWPHGVGARPQWPAGSGSRVFGYLKPFPGIEEFLDALRRSRMPTLIVIDGLDQQTQRRYAGDTLRFENRPLELRETVEQCDVAILNGGHGSATACLLAGKPSLLLPIHMEQLLLSQRVEQFGAARLSPLGNGQRIAADFQALLASARYAQRARDFADRYRDLRPEQQIMELVDHLEQLLLTRN